jgi:hypothetical protein
LHKSLKIGLYLDSWYKSVLPFEVSLCVTAGGEADGGVFAGCCYQVCTVTLLPLYWSLSMGPSPFPEEHVCSVHIYHPLNSFFPLTTVVALLNIFAKRFQNISFITSPWMTSCRSITSFIKNRLQKLKGKIWLVIARSI